MITQKLTFNMEQDSGKGEDRFVHKVRRRESSGMQLTLANSTGLLRARE